MSKTTNSESMQLKELEEILEASFDGIMVTDGEGNCLMANSSYTRNTGILKGDIVGHNVRELLNPVWMKDSIALEVIAKKRSVTMEHVRRHLEYLMIS